MSNFLAGSPAHPRVHPRLLKVDHDALHPPFRSVSGLACAFLALSATAQTPSSPPPATYNQILVDTQRITNEYQLMAAMGARAVTLDLVGFGKGSDAFFQRGHRQDEIGFFCMNATFKGGAMTGTIVRTEASPDTGRFYFLKDCAPIRKK